MTLPVYPSLALVHSILPSLQILRRCQVVPPKLKLEPNVEPVARALDAPEVTTSMSESAEVPSGGRGAFLISFADGVAKQFQATNLKLFQVRPTGLFPISKFTPHPPSSPNPRRSQRIRRPVRIMDLWFCDEENFFLRIVSENSCRVVVVNFLALTIDIHLGTICFLSSLSKHRRTIFTKDNWTFLNCKFL